MSFMFRSAGRIGTTAFEYGYELTVDLLRITPPNPPFVRARWGRGDKANRRALSRWGARMVPNTNRVALFRAVQVMNTEANIVNADGMTEFEEILSHNFTLYRNSDGTFQEKETTVSIVQARRVSLVWFSHLRGHVSHPLSPPLGGEKRQRESNCYRGPGCSTICEPAEHRCDAPVLNPRQRPCHG